jgi:hypothetical protein
MTILRSEPQHKVVVLPGDSEERKKWPIYSGVLSPFPNAIAAVARQSYAGNEKHCDPLKPLYWEFDKSNDHHDCLMRHLLEEDYVAVAWRALALLETKIQNEEYNGPR